MGRNFENRKNSIFKTADQKSKLYSKYGKQLYVVAKSGVADPEVKVALREQRQAEIQRASGGIRQQRWRTWIDRQLPDLLERHRSALRRHSGRELGEVPCISVPAFVGALPGLLAQNASNRDKDQCDSDGDRRQMAANAPSPAFHPSHRDHP